MIFLYFSSHVADTFIWRSCCWIIAVRDDDDDDDDAGGDDDGGGGGGGDLDGEGDDGRNCFLKL